jgi:Flagellar hook-length control protein FliK
MSGVDPLSVGAAQNLVVAAELAFIEAALDLGIPADVLQAQLSVGDLLTGTVLPPQNGHDLLEIFGRQVAAQLPPDVRPGDTLVLQVSGFSGNRIVVRNLGLYDPENPVRTVTPELLKQQQQATPPPPAAAKAPNAPVTLPREVLIAASIRPSLANAQTGTGATTPSAAQPATAPRPTVAQRVIRTAGDLLKAIRVPDTPFTRTAAAIAPQAPARLPGVLQRLEAALPRDTTDPRVPTLRTLIAFTARMNPANAETLPAQISAYVSHVIEGAETKLQQLLRAFVRVDDTAPKPQAPVPAGTPAQLTAKVEAQAEQALQPQMKGNAELPAQPTQVIASRSHDDALRGAPPVTNASQAHAAVRAAAAEHDLKALVLSLLRDPQFPRTPTLTQALNETLITLTGTQFNVLSANAQDPGSIAFALPAFFHDGGKPAYIRIGRDAQSNGAKLDADNFHVAFVLDTANLGTVAIDLQSTGRAVKVNVKTEQQSAATRFSDTLSSLRTRLEDLRYRVTSANAQALKPEKPAAPHARASHEHARNGLDLQA